MKTIYKYPLRVIDEQIIYIPWGAKILSVQVQNGDPCLWALVDSMRTKQEYTIQIVGTGQYIDDPLEELQFLETFQIDSFVGHVFYKK